MRAPHGADGHRRVRAAGAYEKGIRTMQGPAIGPAVSQRALRPLRHAGTHRNAGRPLRRTRLQQQRQAPHRVPVRLRQRERQRNAVSIDVGHQPTWRKRHPHAPCDPPRRQRQQFEELFELALGLGVHRRQTLTFGVVGRGSMATRRHRAGMSACRPTEVPMDRHGGMPACRYVDMCRVREAGMVAHSARTRLSGADLNLAPGAGFRSQHHSQAIGPIHDVGHVVRAKLSHHVQPMRLHGLHADRQQLRDVAIALPLRHELEHLALA